MVSRFPWGAHFVAGRRWLPCLPCTHASLAGGPSCWRLDAPATATTRVLSLENLRIKKAPHRTNVPRVVNRKAVSEVAPRASASSHLNRRIRRRREKESFMNPQTVKKN